MENGTVELNGKRYMYLVNDEYVEYLGDRDGNVYKGSYESGKLTSVTLVASPKSNVEKAILSHLWVTELPREFLEDLPIKYVESLGIDWGDCYPVCYDKDLTVDDVLDSNSWLLWERASGEDLVIDDSYEYARSKIKEEIKTEYIGEFTQGEEDSEEEVDEEIKFKEILEKVKDVRVTKEIQEIWLEQNKLLQQG